MALGLTDIQIVFLQSKANDAFYDGEKLPVNGFPFPQGTWLQRRIQELREEKGNDDSE